MEDTRKQAVASDDPVERKGNDEREGRFPYGGDREGAREAKQVAGPKPVPPPADSSKRGGAAPAGKTPSTRRKR